MATLLWMLDADQAMTHLESDPTMAAALAAIRRTLGRLEDDPADPRLGTRTYRTPAYAFMRATPARHDDWHVFWRPGDRAGEVVIVALSPLTI